MKVMNKLNIYNRDKEEYIQNNLVQKIINNIEKEMRVY